MAKPLVVVFQGKTVLCAIDKIDRTKLYGYVDVDVQDESGKRCELATLTGDGHSIVGKGGTGMGYLSPDGLWRRKTELRPVDVQGKVIPSVKSTFDAPVALERKASVEDYLSHNIHLIYRLTPDEEPTELLAELRGGAIYQFPFSYRGGVEASAGFLILGSDGNLFLCVGTAIALEYVGLKAAAAVVIDETATAAEDEDALDFSLV